tara:strand:- start:933 stop:2324 length:1392 start_codon:yes stop_codon:yes gene_type:complete
MLAGAIIATVLSLISIALIGNLYSPESFAEYRLILSYGTILSLLMTLRLELGIVVSDSINKATNKLLVILKIIFIVAIIIAVILNLINTDNLTNHIGVNKNFLNFIILVGFTLAISEVFRQFYTYRSNFFIISFLNILMQMIFIIFLLIFFYYENEDTGLGLSRIFAFLVICIFGAIYLKKFLSTKLLKLEIIDFVKDNKDYPKYNLTYSFLTQFSQSFPIWILLVMGYPKAAGIFGFLFSLSYFPGMFLNSSIGQVYFKAASKLNNNKNDLLELTDSIYLLLLLSTIPIMFIFTLFNEEIISIIFSEKWLNIEINITYIFLCGYLYIFSSWPERIFVSLKRQDIIFKNQLIFDSLSIIFLVYAYYISMNINQLLIGFISINIAYHLSYISLVRSLLGKNWFKSMLILILILIFFVVSFEFISHVELKQNLNEIIALVFALTMIYCVLYLPLIKNFLTKINRY